MLFTTNPGACYGGAQVEACCLPDGSCEDLPPAECEARGGIPWGPGTVCSPGFCLGLVGACCLPTGECIDTLPIEECTAQDGVWQGPYTNCAMVTCAPNALAPQSWGRIKGLFR
jgi:hypothetical protein